MIIAPFIALIYRSYKKQKQKSPEQRRKDGKKAIIAFFALGVFCKIIKPIFNNWILNVDCCVAAKIHSYKQVGIPILAKANNQIEALLIKLRSKYLNSLNP